MSGFAMHVVQQPDDGQEFTIQAQFEAFHRLNPWVLDALENLTAHFLDSGARRIGMGMLFEVLRWRYITEAAATEGDEFRLNNNHRSRYVRLLIERHPEWAPAFEVRVLRTR